MEIKYEKSELLEIVQTLVWEGIESGATYWCGVDVKTEMFKDRKDGEMLSDFIIRKIMDGENIRLYDIEDEEEKFMLSLNGIEKGVNLFVKNMKKLFDAEDADAEDADLLLQWSVFGQIVYG